MKYKIEIYCDVNKHDSVIPTGGSVELVDDNGKTLDQLEWPTWDRIVMIWIGKYLQYPKRDRLEEYKP